MILFVVLCLLLGFISLIGISGFTIGDEAIDAKILARNRVFVLIICIVFLGLYLSIKGKLSKTYAALIAGSAVGICFVIFKQITKKQEQKQGSIALQRFTNKPSVSSDIYNKMQSLNGKVVSLTFSEKMTLTDDKGISIVVEKGREASGTLDNLSRDGGALTARLKPFNFGNTMDFAEFFVYKVVSVTEVV
jgi:hypothetical protein